METEREETNKLQLYKEVMHNLEELVLLTDHTGKIVRWNVKATEELYYEREEFETLWIDQVVGQKQERVHKYQWEGSVYRKNGTCFFAKIKQVLVKDETIESVYLITSLEKQKRQEEELRKLQQELAEANERKQSFLANVTHELRTPINGMKGMALLLSQSLADKKQQETVAVMQSCCENMEHIVNDILAYSKLAKGKMKLEVQEFSFREWIKGVIAVQEPVIRQKNLAFSCNVEERVPDTLVGDSYHLSQVLGNLLNNAVKFTKEGKISVEVLLREVRENQVSLLFAVTDTGIGIRQEKQEELFESFTQADPSITREFGGTGLGLAIAKELVGLMHGEIGVESREGAGSRFYFTVWLNVAEAQEEKKAEHEAVAVNIDAQSKKELLAKIAVCMEFESFEKAEELAHQLKELVKEEKEGAAKQVFRLELALRKQNKEKIRQQYDKLLALLTEE